MDDAPRRFQRVFFRGVPHDHQQRRSASAIAAYAEKLARIGQQPDSFVAVLLELSRDIGQRLETIPKREFPKAWLLHTLVLELLKYSIEDDYIEIDDVRPTIIEALQTLLQNQHWPNPSLKALLDACHRVAQKETIPAKRVEVCAPIVSGDCRLTGWVAEAARPLIPVSGTRSPFVPILEESVTNPTYARSVVGAFSERLLQLREEQRVSCLCFIEKAVGPVGALAMASSLVSELSLPACIYREGYWPRRAKLTGYQPQPNDRIALVYDLLVTGNGVRRAANDLTEKFDATVIAAVVLLGYGARRDTLEINNHKTIKLEAISWYENFAEQIEQIRKKKVPATKTIAVLSNGNSSGSTRSPAADGGTSASRHRMAGE